MSEYFIPIYTIVSRLSMPVFSFALISGSLSSLIREQHENAPPPAEIIFPLTGEHMPLSFNENSVGRERLSDVTLNFPSISRRHAAIKYEKNEWIITDLDSASGVEVNGVKVSEAALHSGDRIELGGVALLFNIPDCAEPAPPGKLAFFKRKIFNRQPVPWGRLFFYMIVFQLMAAIQTVLRADTSHTLQLSAVFLIYFLFEWLCFLVSFYILKRGNFAHELIGLYLTGIGLCIIAASEPQRSVTQLIIIVASLLLFFLVFSIVRKQGFMMRIRPVLASFGLALFAANLILGTSRFGSKNWLEIAGFSFQPSELIKVIFILVGAVTLEKLSDKKDMLLFSLYSCACILCLFVMGDFGTASIFFVTFIVIFLMRTGNLKLAAAICLTAVLAMVLIITVKPYIANRFAAWLHVWEYPSTIGYQQTRSLIAAASGGLFGVGVGAGYLKNVAAATTDLVFGMLCEEWGLIVSVISVSVFAGLGMASCSNIKNSRGSYYAIAGCASAGLLIFQACLNIFGATDILPLTGVTLPFISRGGSSVISCWILLAIIKASHFWEIKTPLDSEVDNK